MSIFLDLCDVISRISSGEIGTSRLSDNNIVVKLC